MYLKRGLIYLVVLLLIPIVYSQSFTCEDGTFFGNCKPGTNLFCGGPNMIYNGGFEIDHRGDGIPDNYLIDPNAILGKDVFHSDEEFAGRKSIKLTKRWHSFDYSGDFFGSIFLQPSTEYLFSAFVKGSCNDTRVYYGPQIGPEAEQLCGSQKPCALVNSGDEWSRLVTQFNSDDIILPEGFEDALFPILQFLRIECADTSSFELYIDNMHLQAINEAPNLFENEICEEVETIRSKKSLSDQYTSAINSKNCDGLTDDNLKDSCYNYIINDLTNTNPTINIGGLSVERDTACDFLDNKRQTSTCQKTFNFFNKPTIGDGISYKAYKCEGDGCFLSNFRFLDQIDFSSFQKNSVEFSINEYKKISSSETITNKEEYNLYQATTLSRYFVYIFEAPQSAEELIINIITKSGVPGLSAATNVYNYENGELERKAEIITSGSVVFENNGNCVSGCTNFDSSNVVLPVQVVEGKAVLLIQGPINFIQATEVIY